MASFFDLIYPIASITALSIFIGLVGMFIAKVGYEKSAASDNWSNAFNIFLKTVVYSGFCFSIATMFFSALLILPLAILFTFIGAA